jgi:kynurenine formamidase
MTPFGSTELTTERIVDLTLPHYHGLRGVEIHPNTRIAAEGYNTTNLRLYSHAGTHMDAPRHFIDEGRTIDRIDLAKCIGPALVIDLSHKAPNSFITIEDMAAHAEQIGAGSRLLLRTDWDLHADLPDYRTSFPRISLALAEWMAERGVWLVGLEMPSVASLQDKQELTDVHRALLRAEIVIVECLANLRLLPPRVTFIALPLKIKEGDGTPIRAVAVIESADSEK